MPVAMELSVVICTCNRAPELRRTLETMRALIIPPSLQWELIIVDNNSTDNTRAVCDEFSARLPLRYVFEPRQGVAIARNCGAASARGDLIIYADDDVDVSTGWLSAYQAASVAFPEVVFFGGRIQPLWMEKPPRWFLENAGTVLQGVTGCFDLGNRNQLTVVGFFGANMAFRRGVFEGGARFREDIGRTPDSLLHGEETELFQRLMAHGEKGCYVADALVRHRIPAKRMTERYVRAWFHGLGVTRARVGEVGGGVLCCAVPISVWFDLFYNALRYALTRWTGLSRLWLKPATKMAAARGIVSGLHRR